MTTMLGPGASPARTAADLLAAVRAAHDRAAVVSEVVITDPVAAAAWDAVRAELYRAGAPATAQQRAVVDDQQPVQRRIDALMYEAGAWTALEFKTTHADFLRETDAKRAPWRAVTHRFVYVAPPGVIGAHEVPAGCGLWEVDTVTGKPRQAVVRVVARARRNPRPDPIPEQVLVAFAYRLTRATATQASGTPL